MNQKSSLLLTFTIAALLVFAPHKASAACGSLPNVFVNGVSTVDASTTNANNNFLVACAKNVDNTQIGAAGIYASQIIPTNGAQATFGGAQTYTFPAAVTTGGALTVPSGGATITAGGLTVSAGGATITGTVAVTGAITATTTITAGTGLTVSAGGATITGPVAVTGAITATTSIAAGSATGATLTAGDVGASRGVSSGEVQIGGSTSAGTVDYGVTTAGVVTINKPTTISGATIVSSGGLNVTGAITGSAGAVITGAITATSSIAAGSGTGPALTAGDLGASRGTSSGAVILGGSSSSMTLDYGVTTASVLTSNTRFNDTAAISAGSGTQATLTAGDLGASRTASTGAVTIGGSSSAATLDYGVTTGNALTNNTAFNNTNSISAGSATGGALTAGDIGASRSTTTGGVRIGGSGSSALFDYGVTTAGALTVDKQLQAKSVINSQPGVLAGSPTFGPAVSLYGTTGAGSGITTHGVFGSCTTSSATNCGITFTNNAQFTSSITYACSGSSPGSAGVNVQTTSGTAVTATFSDAVARSATIDVICIGS